MDFVDAATGTGGRHTETDVGRAQTEQGISRIETGGNSAAHPSATSTAAPPLPSRNNQAGTVESNDAVVGDHGVSQTR